MSLKEWVKKLQNSMEVTNHTAAMPPILKSYLHGNCLCLVQRMATACTKSNVDGNILCIDQLPEFFHDIILLHVTTEAKQVSLYQNLSNFIKLGLGRGLGIDFQNCVHGILCQALHTSFYSLLFQETWTTFLNLQKKRSQSDNKAL